MNEECALKLYCYLNGDRESIKGGSLSFPKFLLVKYQETQEKELIWDNRYAEWCDEKSSSNTPTSRFTSAEEDFKPRPKDYPFKDWLLTKEGHTDIKIDQLADEYELGIGKKGHMLEDIWEDFKKLQGNNSYWWHDHGQEENERQEIGLEMKEYSPPKGIGIQGLLDSFSYGKKVLLGVTTMVTS
ncbi:hypothetical protein Tco_1466396, partial [Tanacetum coccineum]